MGLTGARWGAAAVALSVALGIGSAAHAQDWPTGPVTMIVPFPVGGATDTSSRIFAEQLSAALGQPVVVENRGGANGATGTRAAARAAPDGYTLVYNASNYPINMHGMKEPGYTWEDFVTVGGVGYNPMVMVANTSSTNAKTLREFVDFAKANPGKLTYATFGPQSVANLAAHRFATIAGIQWREVPYNGAPQVIQDLVRGAVDVYFGLTTVGSQVLNHENIVGYGFSDDKRTEHLQGVPTFAEAGFPEMNEYTLVGVWAPAGVPEPVLEKLRNAVEEAKKSPKVAESLERIGTFIYQGTHEEFDKDVREAADRYGAEFKRLGIEPQ